MPGVEAKVRPGELTEADSDFLCVGRLILEDASVETKKTLSAKSHCETDDSRKTRKSQKKVSFPNLWHDVA